MKTKKLYAIRRWRADGMYSLSAGRRLRDRSRALRLVKYLCRRRGLDAFAVPCEVRS
jgi:hypothetical protein